MFELLILIFVVILMLSLIMKDNGFKIRFISIIMILFSLITILFLSYDFFTGITFRYSIFWYDIFNIWPVENLFMLILLVLLIWIFIYTIYYFDEYLYHKKNLKYYMSLFLLFIFSMFWVIISNELIIFLFFWEMMSLTSFFLVIWDFEKKWVLMNWIYYLVITHIWMFFIFLSYLPFIDLTWSTLFLDWVWRWNELSIYTKNFVFICTLIWFFSKAWIVPIHVWLPKAHPIAPSNVSALMSGFMIKLPVLMLFKTIFVYFSSDIPLYWGVVILIFALISSFFGIFYAMIQDDLKRLLAYSSIENIWIIFIWFWMAVIWSSINNDMLISLGILACFYHLINHSVFKSLMFLCAWSLIERTGSWIFTILWWLIKKLPLFWLIMMIWVLAITALPPLNWFIGEFFVFLGLMYSMKIKLYLVLFMFWLIIFSVVSALALITFLKFFTVTFLWEPREPLNIKLEKNKYESMWLIYFIILIFWLAIFPWFIIRSLNIVLENYWFNLLVSSENVFTINIWEFWTFNNFIIMIFILLIAIFVYILFKNLIKSKKVVESWNCWYHDFLKSSQYNAFSFIQPIRRIFASLYKEKKILERSTEFEVTKHNKQIVSYDYNIKAFYIFEHFLYDPIIRLFGYINAKVRKVQNWDLQIYITYILWAFIVCLWYFFITL